MSNVKSAESAILHSSLFTLQSSIVFILLAFQFLFAAPPDSLPRDTLPLKPPDTLSVRPDTVKVKAERPAPGRIGHRVRVGGDGRNRVGGESEPFVPKSGTAVLLSGLIPGGGQFYVHQPLKGAVIAATELTLAGFSVYYHTQKNEDTRNTFLWWTGFVWAVSMADAYVSASLYGFKEEQRLDLQLSPMQLGMSYRF